MQIAFPKKSSTSVYPVYFCRLLLGISGTFEVRLQNLQHTLCYFQFPPCFVSFVIHVLKNIEQNKLNTIFAGWRSYGAISSSQNVTQWPCIRWKAYLKLFKEHFYSIAVWQTSTFVTVDSFVLCLFLRTVITVQMGLFIPDFCMYTR